VRAVKYQSGRFDVHPGCPLPDALLREDVVALRAGMANVAGHLSILKEYGLPAVVAINRFPTDKESELRLLHALAVDAGAQRVVLVDAFSRGSDGALELADAVIDACSGEDSFRSLYPLDLPYAKKIHQIATRVYGASGVDFHEGVQEQLNELARRGYDHLPVCIAKTPYSLSHDASRLGRPIGFQLPIREVRLSAGAGFVLALTDGISLMPGLPREPAARRIDVDAEGRIAGLGS
jgi:formate--tetrahydrofolate ligase